jgi:hypothetical protein
LDAHPGGAWAHREAWAATARLEDFLEQNHLGRLPLRQIVFAPELTVYSENDDHREIIRDIRRRAEKAVRRVAWRGYAFGSAVVHLYRGCAGAYDRWGPHVHLVCPGIDVRGFNAWKKHELECGRKVDYVLKQVNSSHGGFASYRRFGLARHLCYELGHASIMLRIPAITWWGALKSWKTPEPKGEGEVDAPLCSAGEQMSLFEVRWNMEIEVDREDVEDVKSAPIAVRVRSPVWDLPGGFVPGGPGDHLTDHGSTIEKLYTVVDGKGPPGPGYGKPPPADCPYCTEETICGVCYGRGYR